MRISDWSSDVCSSDLPGCCTVSVRSQLGRTLLPEYGKFHGRVQPWSGNVRRRPIQKFVCRGTAHWLRFMAVFVCFLAVIGVGTFRLSSCSESVCQSV